MVEADEGDLDSDEEIGSYKAGGTEDGSENNEEN